MVFSMTMRRSRYSASASLLVALLCAASCLVAVPARLLDDPSQSSRQLIIHGQTAVKGRYPYFCTLDHYGGGALIAPDIILTAGHTKPGRRGDVQPRVGTYNFKHDVAGKDYEQFQIQEMVRHPHFVHVGADEFIRDFTILKLKGQSSKPVVRINRHSHLPTSGQPVTAMGVGNTHADYESKSNVLRHVVLNAIPNDVCEESESDSDPDREDESYQGRIFPSMMCTTGGPHNERDACSYDSGSPIIIPGDGTTDHPDILVGLVSWGVLCADPDYPGVNARVSEVSDWIDAMVCDLSDNPPVDFFCQGSLAPSESPSANPTATAAPAAFPFEPPAADTEWTSSSRNMVILILLLVALAVCLMNASGILRFLVKNQNKHERNKTIMATSSSSLDDEQERLRPDINYDKADSYDSIVGIEVSNK
jgi:secreted trypsin-like serine protease